MKAKKNDVVKVHYTGKLTSGEVFDSSEGKAPLEFTVGGGQMIKGFDNAVDGMEVNEKKTITVPANEAYGEHNNELIQEIPKTSLPNDLDPEVGQKLVATNDLGHQTRVSVTEVNSASIKIDANHELAGKDLVFDIQLVDIN